MRKRKSSKEVNSWPGFVDALSALLLIFMFMMAIFAVISFSLGRSTVSKDERLNTLSQQIQQKQSEVEDLQAIITKLNNSLSLVKDENLEVITKLNKVLADKEQADSDDEAELYKEQIIALEAARNKLLNEVTLLRNQQAKNAQLVRESEDVKSQLLALEASAERSQEELNDQVATLTADLETTQAQRTEFEKISLDLQSKIVVLEQQINTLTGQLARVETALETKDQIISDKEVEIADLGNRINAALVDKVNELQTYRSDFFSALRKALGDSEDISVVGDRFVISSGILFPSGSASLNTDGMDSVDKLAMLVKEIEDKIPSDISWIIRVDGHTDRIPYHGSDYKDNWDLSNARALSVVRQLISRGVAPQRLVAAGFGEYHPIVESNDRQELAKNRRIEIKLTEK